MDSYRPSDISVEAQLSLFFNTCCDPGLSSYYEFKVKDKVLGRYLGGIFAKNFGCLRLSELPISRPEKYSIPRVLCLHRVFSAVAIDPVLQF